MAIGATDGASLLPQARQLLRSVLGEGADVDALLDEQGLRAERLASRDFDQAHLEFVSAVGEVLHLLDKRRRCEVAALQEVEGRFQRIFQSSPVALGLSTINDGRIVDVNQRFLAMFGYRRDEVIGRTNAQLHLSDSRQRDALVAQLQTDGMLRDIGMTVRKKSGELIDIVVSAVQIQSGGTSSLWLSSILDVTSEKRAEAERDSVLAREQVARAEAEHALERLRAVYAITDSIPPSASLGELLNDVLRRLRRTLQIDYASVLLLDDDRKALQLRAIEGPQAFECVPLMRIPIGCGVSGRIAVEGRPMIVNDYDASVDVSDAETEQPELFNATRSVMGAPFAIGDRVAGVVLVSTIQPRQFDDEQLRLLVLAADRVGPAIERGRLIEKIRIGLQRQRALSRRLLTAQEEERRRLAVELHDELGQVLTAVKINLESLSRPASGAPFTSMAATIVSVDEALLRVRDMALDLRPSVLDDLGLAAALRWYVHRFARSGRIETHLSIDLLPRLEPEVQTACFRVAQEALTNVDRHARATHVWIDLHVLDGALELGVRDDGIGFDVAAARVRAMSGASVGLLGMQERVSLLGGEYDIVQVPAGGTAVRARFPLPAGGGT